MNYEFSSSVASTLACSATEYDSNKGKDKTTAAPSNDEILFETVQSNAASIDNTSYDAVVAVIGQFDANKSKRNIMSVTYANLMHNHNRFRFKKWNKKVIAWKVRLNPGQLNDLKSNSKFHNCGTYGHWDRDHIPDGALPQDRGNINNVVTELLG